MSAKHRNLPYREFERSVIEPIHSYWRVHDERMLAQSADAVSALGARVATQHQLSDLETTTFEGWLQPGLGFAISRRTLRALNPGFEITVRRFQRAELGRYSKIKRAGFIVRAMAPHGAPPFRFRIVDRSGQLHLLPGSNDAVEASRQTFDLASDGLSYAEKDRARGLTGYLDEIRRAPIAEPDRPETWLASVSHHHRPELLDLVDSPYGQQFAALVAGFLANSPANERWADRFALSAFGTKGTFVSDLTALSVIAPNPSESAPVDGALLPQFHADGDIVHTSTNTRVLPAPSTQWLSLEDVAVQDGGTVLTETELVLYEESANPASDFVSGQYETVFGSHNHPEAVLVKLRPVAPETIDEAILLAGRNDANWFHWFAEYLPRIVMAKGVIDDDVPVLVTGRVPASGMAALQKLSTRPVITITPEERHRVRRLHVVAPPVQIKDSTRTPWSAGLSINPRPLAAMRTDLGLDNALPNPRRVFLQRRSAHRGLLNEGELATIATSLGLDIVEPGAMSFQDQLDLFSSSQLLVGASGAVMANYMMMKPDSRVLALTSRSLDDFVLPAALASVAGVHFTYVVGSNNRELADVRVRNDWIHSSFTIDKATFERALRAELAALDAAVEQ